MCPFPYGEVATQAQVMHTCRVQGNWPGMLVKCLKTLIYKHIWLQHVAKWQDILLSPYYHTCGNQSARDITEFSRVNMDEWYYGIHVVCDTMEFEFILMSPPLVWSTPLGLPSQYGICMHQHSTSGIRRRRIRRWYSTYWHMVQCKGVGWLLGGVH